MSTQPDFAELPAAVQGRIDELCDALEAAWQQAVTHAKPGTGASDSSAEWPRLEVFVQGLNPEERGAALKELVPIEVSYRRRCSAPVTAADYARFEELDADWLTEIVRDPEGATQRVADARERRTESHAEPKPPPSPPPTCEVFVERLIASNLLTREIVEREAAAHPAGRHSAVTLGERLVARGLLTPFQFSSLLRSPAPSLVLGEYIILSPLGRGGMGAVYRARHRRMDRIVALKVLPPSAANDPQASSRFRREIRAVARLTHPNIVAAHDAGEDSGVAYLVMECIEGIDLSTCVRTHGPLSIAHAVECLAQAADGLEYAHQQGIIHRDIKPSNLILCLDRTGAAAAPNANSTLGATGGRFEPPVPLQNTGGSKQSPVAPDSVAEHSEVSVSERTVAESMALRGRDGSPHALAPSLLRLKVLDLGLARFEADTPSSAGSDASPVLTRSGMMFGTPEYMSPEQAVNASTADQRADIYSLGCTLYFLLTGRTVVAGKTFLETVMAHQLQVLPSPLTVRADVPVELETVYRRMTARLPEQRYASMREVHEALRAIPVERLSRVPGAVMLKSPTHDSAARHAGATEWFAALQGTDATQEPTVLVSDLDASALARLRPGERAGSAAGSSQNRVIALSLVSLLACLLLAGGVWRGMWPGVSERTVEKSATSPQPKVSPPPPLSCPAGAAIVLQRQREWAEFLGKSPVITDNIGIRLCLIPPGEFVMGTTESEFNSLPGRGVPEYEIEHVRQELPSRRVQLTKPFWIGQTEVTVGQFRRFVEATEPHFVTETEATAGFGLVNNQWVLQPGFSWQNVGEATVSENHPASNLTWNDAVAYCEWLSRHESQASGKSVRYRLPTEAEWEFACRAGTETPWYFGPDPATINNHAIFGANSNRRLQPVGTCAENPFQLYDILGNQAEWCHDWFAPYGNTDAIDPTGPLNGQDRVQRGGNFGNTPLRLRSAARQNRSPHSPQDGSLRVVREE